MQVTAAGGNRQGGLGAKRLIQTGIFDSGLKAKPCKSFSRFGIG